MSAEWKDPRPELDPEGMVPRKAVAVDMLKNLNRTKYTVYAVMFGMFGIEVFRVINYYAALFFMMGIICYLGYILFKVMEEIKYYQQKYKIEPPKSFFTKVRE